MRNWVVVAMLGLITGPALAAKKPTPEQIAAADYGRDMTQEEVEDLARAKMQTFLKDPDSAQWKCEPIKKGWIVHNNGFRKDTTMYGWQVNCMINAKNSYGGYVGYREHKFYARDGALIGVLEANKSGTDYIPL